MSGKERGAPAEHAGRLLEKRRLRKAMQQQRRALENRDLLQERLASALLTLPPLFDPSAPLEAVAVFAALPDEASPEPLAAYLRARGVATVYPRVEGDDLVFAEATPETLRRGKFGVLEPTEAAKRLPLAAVDLFVVPGLAFTPTGDRLGYGRGYYDRTLKRARQGRSGHGVPAIGVAFHAQLVESLPVEPHDERLHGLVTERGYLPCRRPEP